MHGILCLVGLFGFTAFHFIFPETSQPGERGIEKMNAANGIDSFRFINPLEPLWLLRSPSMLLTVRFFFYSHCTKQIADQHHQKGFHSIFISDGFS